MRCLLLFLAFTFATGLSAQVKTDTIYDRWGQLAQIRYSSKMDLDTKSKSYLFQRGIRAGDIVFELDSVQLFKEGKSMTIKGEAVKGVPRPGELRSSYNSSVREASKKKVKANFLSTATDYVEGRAGMLVRRKVLHPNSSESTGYKRLDDSPEIELVKQPDGENKEITAKVRIPAGATERKLILDFGDGKQWEKLYTIRGYHLNESDFRREDQLTEEQTWHAEGQHYLYLRLRSTEKLLYISQGETRYKPVPVGRQLDEVYLKGLSTGKYLLEIIDLGTKEKRFHWLVIGS